MAPTAQLQKMRDWLFHIIGDKTTHPAIGSGEIIRALSQCNCISVFYGILWGYSTGNASSLQRNCLAISEPPFKRARYLSTPARSFGYIGICQSRTF